MPAGFTATTAGETDGLAATATPQSGCVAHLTKSVDPSSLAVGSEAQASMGISVTCGARSLPVDMLILADDSHSMARGQGGGIGETPTRDPDNTPEPGTPDPGPTRPGDEPSWCSGNVSGVASITPTRRFRTPTPGPIEPTEDPEEAGTEDRIREAKGWVKDFVGRPDIERDLASDRLRVGFVSFNDETRIRQALTSEISRITGAANRLSGGGTSLINVGLREAERQLVGSTSRFKLGDPNRVQVLVILSDFNFCKRDVNGFRPNKNLSVITVGMGRRYNERNAQSMASDRNMALGRNDLRDFDELYAQVLAVPKPVTLSKLTARDELSEGMDLLPGSVQPMTATITGQLIEWPLDPLAFPWSLGYRVAPQLPGLQPLSASAYVQWTDSEGLPGSAPFPDVNIDVIPMTATPTPTFTATPTATDIPTNTPTHTATPTATRTPAPGYLPILYRLWPEAKPCVPAEQTVDLGLIIDTSLSMSDPTQAGGQPKLEAAIEAALEIVALLKPTDQAAVVGFNANAHLASQLTSNRLQLEAALRSLPATQGQGTAIDKGLRAGFDELYGPRHRSENNRSIILVTDGTQTTGTNQDVRDAANAIKAAGIKLVTVGLGSEIDEALLTEIASDSRLYFRSPTAEGLKDIYRQIAELIPCP